MSLLMNRHSNPNTQAEPEDTPEPDPAAAAAAQQQIINAEAAGLLASANALLPSLSGPAPGAPPGTPTPPDPNATLSALLDDGPPSNTSTAAISALLGGSSQQGTGDATATNAVNNLLADSNTLPPAVNVPQDPNATKPGDPFYQPPAPDPSQGYTPPTPLQDQDMNAELQDSIDQPNPTIFDTFKKDVSDEFDQLIDKGRQLIAPIVYDPGVQFVCHVISNGPTMPVTQPTDSGDTMVNNVAGSALLTGVGIVKVTTTSPEEMLLHPKDTYDNINAPGDQMSDQVAGMMGWAQANVMGDNGRMQP
jgi:hypothetical protein